MPEMPMFPLSTVLLPGQLLPLHIFEPRYQQMLASCLQGSAEFGVVLIERGHEVGGGDVRTEIGTVARIVRADQLTPGHWAVISTGTRRLRVRTWLPDDPWPRADIEDLIDEDEDSTAPAGVANRADTATGDPGPETPEDWLTKEWTSLQVQYRRLAALATEFGGQNSPAEAGYSDEPRLGTFQLAALAPLGDLDRQRVLATTSLASRIDVLSTLLAESEDLMLGMLTMDSDGPGGPPA